VTELLDAELSRFTIQNATAGNFRMVDGVLEVREPDGWLRSKQRYADFELLIEFRYLTDDADSGLFLRTQDPGSFRRGWPSESYQVQIRNPAGPSPYPPVAYLFRHGMPHGDTHYDESLARAVSRPTGEWQTLIVRAVAAEVLVAVNGVETTRARGVKTGPGFIGIQGETGALQFKSLRLTAI